VRRVTSRLIRRASRPFQLEMPSFGGTRIALPNKLSAQTDFPLPLVRSKSSFVMVCLREALLVRLDERGRRMRLGGIQQTGLDLGQGSTPVHAVRTERNTSSCSIVLLTGKKWSNNLNHEPITGGHPFRAQTGKQD